MRQPRQQRASQSFSRHPSFSLVDRIEQPSMRHEITRVRCSEVRRFILLLCLSGTSIVKRCFANQPGGREAVNPQEFQSSPLPDCPGDSRLLYGEIELESREGVFIV